MKKAKLPELVSGIKLCTQIPADVSDDFLTFLEQIGVYYVYAWFSEEQFNYNYLCRIRDMCNKHNITLFNVGAVHMAKSRSIILGKEDRDKDIEMFNKCLHMLSKVGIHTTTITWEPDGVWASDWDYPTRGGALTRKCDMSILYGNEINKDTRYTQIPIDTDEFVKSKLTHGRIYTNEEMWENYTYFIKRVIPVAEEFGVRLALHPNDPPVDSIAGVSCLIQNFDDFKRAFEIGNSDFIGMELCCGCWLEAADSFGDLEKAVKYFVNNNKVFLVHFRNVDKQLPCFVETFVDDGYGDMLEIMKLFMQVEYNGTLVMDHSPRIVVSAGLYGESAYANGYIKAIMNCAKKLL